MAVGGQVDPRPEVAGAGSTRGLREWDLETARAHLRRADPLLACLIDADPDLDPREWLSELPPLDCFGALVFQIIGQQLSVVATRRILDRLQDRFRGHLPSPGQVLASEPEDLRAAGLSMRKAATIRSVARAFADGALDDHRLEQMSDEEIERALTAIPGVGPWTVHGFLIIALNRPDVVLPGDLALRKAIRVRYGLEHIPSPDEVVGIAEVWRPYRSLATAYLFQSFYGARDSH